MAAGTAVAQSSDRLPWMTLVLVGLALVLYCVAGPAPPDLVFDRQGIAHGELWRLITGHWVHVDPGHALWDIAALLGLGLLFEPLLRARLGWVLALASLTVDAALWWAVPDLARYCGLSGILHGLLGAGLVQTWRTTRSSIVWLVGAGAALKIACEWASGQMLLTATAWPGVPAAHAAGFATGLIAALLQTHGSVYSRFVLPCCSRAASRMTR